MNDERSLREKYFSAVWTLLYPIRCYLTSFPFPRGKGLLLRYFLTPLLPPADAEFEQTLPGQATVSLRYRETLGLSSLLYGTFEKEELAFVNQYLQHGENAMDIGANVGIFSAVMGRSVGPAGHVFAFEPVPSNCLRLKRNLERNALKNVQVFPVALGASEGTMRLRMAKDAAYHSFGKIEGGFGDGQELPVQVRRLDSLWEEIGRPEIGLVKMDVEGAECDVVLGASEFLGTCRPLLLIEANSIDFLARLQELLASLGYRYKHLNGFAAHNYLFYCPERDSHLSALS